MSDVRVSSGVSLCEGLSRRKLERLAGSLWQLAVGEDATHQLAHGLVALNNHYH